MKSKILYLSAAILLLCAACDKQKTCRCSVMGKMDVRIIKIEKGSCEDIVTYQYHDALDSLKMDSLLCTDYEFLIDSIYKQDGKEETK